MGERCSSDDTGRESRSYHQRVHIRYSYGFSPSFQSLCQRLQKRRIARRIFIVLKSAVEQATQDTFGSYAC